MEPKGLSAALEELGWTQNSLARRLGTSNTIVSRWATGKAKMHRFAVAYIDLALEVKRISVLLAHVVEKK